MVGVENESKHGTSVTHNQQFGFLPSDTLQLYTRDLVYYQTISDIISTHLMHRESGFRNFLQCRIPVKSKLNVDRWCFHLLDYWDQSFQIFWNIVFPLTLIEIPHYCLLVTTRPLLCRC